MTTKQDFNKRLGLFMIVAFLGIGAMSFSLAQNADPAVDPAATPAVAPEESKTTLITLIMQGGITMIPLALLSMGMVTLGIRNFLSLKEEKLLRPDLVPLIQEHLANHDVVAAYELCQSDATLLTAIVGAGLERITSDEIEIEVIKEAIEESGTEQMMVYMTPIGYLSIIGAVSPMVGLLGTVSGMIKAFQTISKVGMGKAEQLAGNIGEALVTTATGLIIAIPSMILYFYFKNKFMKTMATAGRISGTLLDTLKTGELPATYGVGGGAAAGQVVEEVVEEDDDDDI